MSPVRVTWRRTIGRARSLYSTAFAAGGFLAATAALFAFKLRAEVAYRFFKHALDTVYRAVNRFYFISREASAHDPRKRRVYRRRRSARLPHYRISVKFSHVNPPEFIIMTISNILYIIAHRFSIFICAQAAVFILFPVKTASVGFFIIFFRVDILKIRRVHI